MNQYLVDNQINLQYLTQLLQNSDFDIKKYQRRSNLLNADGLHSRELMNLFRAFQDHLISGLNRHRSSKKSQALPSSNELALKNAEPLQPVKFKDESQLELNQEQRIEIKSENQNECGSSQNKVVSKQNLRKSQQLRDKLNEREEKDIIRIEMDDQEVIEFPKQIQKHSFGQTKLILKGQLNQVSISVMRRLAFLSVSGCIGFDDSERAEFIKAAFLLKFDQFFEYLTRHIVMNLLDFGDNADEVLDILIFMWQTDLGRSEHYSDFISKLAISNPKLYKRKFEISPNILKLDVGLLESKLLPLIHKLLSSDRYLPQKQVRIIISQVVEYYQIHSGKKVYFPFLQQKAEEEVIQFVEKRFQNILKEFECSLCLKPFDNCHTTKCGHSFCKKCIESSVEVFKSCPVCLTYIYSHEELIRNFHLIEIQKQTLREIESCKIQELNRLKHINSFKTQFQHLLHTNIINSLQESIEVQGRSMNNEVLPVDQLSKLKKQINYLVNITFDQAISQFDSN